MTIFVPDSKAGILTIGDALDVAQEGDTIHLFEGNYFGGETVSISNLIIEGEGAVTISGISGSCSPAIPAIQINHATGVAIRGLTLRGSGSGSCGGPTSPSSDGSVAISILDSEVILKDCKMRASSNFVVVLATDSNLTLERCDVLSRDGSSPSSGLTGGRSGPTEGGIGLFVTRTNLQVTESIIVGGKGGDSGILPIGFSTKIILIFLLGAKGGSAIKSLEEGTIILNSSTIMGGDGGDGNGTSFSNSLIPGSGGCAVFGDSLISVTSNNSVVQGGTSGLSLSYPPNINEPYCGVDLSDSETAWVIW